jgi:YHS domain-containing protein
MATDPVCHMAVETTNTPHIEIDSNLWWFCSTRCRDEFAANPERFTSTRTPAESRR